MIASIETLKAVLNKCKGDGTFSALERIYGQIPRTSCARCGACCRPPPCIYTVEFAYLCHAIRRRGLENEHPDLLRHLFHYSWAQWMLPDEHCPFLYEKSCVIYAWRPLSCRLFGIVTEQAQRENVDRAQSMTDWQVKVFSEEGIELKPDVFHHVVPRCDRVRDHQERRLALNPVPLLQDIVQLELSHVPEDEVSVGQSYVPFDAHLALAILGPDELISRKISAMKRYQAGKNPDDTTAELMQGVTFRFAHLSYPRQPRRGSCPS